MNSRQKKDASPAPRLQKVLAWAGLGSRRECEALITDGRVEIDREVVTELGTRVNADEQEVRVDGVPLAKPKRQYYLLNKPTGVVCTNRDPEGRTRVIDLVPAPQRLFHVGRLDRSSEGLILITNDGELANRLTHPRYGIKKTYRVFVAGHPQIDELNQLLEGVHLAEGVAKVDSIKIKKRHAKGTELEIVLREGRNREIRRLLARIGHKVLRLKRIGLGPLRIDDLIAGEFRRLAPQEVQALWDFVQKRGTRKKASKPGPSKARHSPKSAKGPEKRGPGKKGPGKAKSAKDRAAGKKGKPPTPSQPQGAVLGYDDEKFIEPESRDAESSPRAPRKGGHQKRKASSQTRDPAQRSKPKKSSERSASKGERKGKRTTTGTGKGRAGKGKKTSKGSKGFKGPKGSKGSKGGKGSKGFKGTQGGKGGKGPKGGKGGKTSKGSKGPKGSKGSRARGKGGSR